jgi:hypothetical protein
MPITDSDLSQIEARLTNLRAWFKEWGRPTWTMSEDALADIAALLEEVKRLRKMVGDS